MRRTNFLLLLLLASVLLVPFHNPTRGSGPSNSLSAGTTRPDFSIQCCFSTGDGTVQVTAGQTYSSWGWVYSLNSFAGTVNLSLNLPFTSSITLSVTLTPGATAEPDISISPSSSTPGGTYSGSITGTSGSLTHSIQLSITVYPAPQPPQGVVCFSTTVNSCPSSPAQFTAPLGGMFTAYVVIEGSNAFNGFNIWFSYPYGVLNATDVSLQSSVLSGANVQFECVNGGGSSSCGYWLGNGPGIVALSATGNVTTDPVTGLLYSVTFKVTGTGSGGMGFFCVTSPSGPWFENCASVFNGSPCNSTTCLNMNVQGATFTTGPSSDPSIQVQQTISFDYVTATISGNLTLDSTTKTITGSLSVSVVNSTSGQTIFSNTFRVSVGYASINARFVLSMTTSTSSLGAACSVNVSTNMASCTVSRDPDVNFDGAINILDLAQMAFAYGALKGETRYNASGDLNADGVINILDLALAAFDYQLPVFS